MPDPFDLAWEALRRSLPLDVLEGKMDEARQKLGRVNILIAGKTGVGKTTLVNAVFGAKVGRTGTGAPITTGITWYELPGLPLRLCDTRGLELAAYEETLAALKRELLKSSASNRIEDRLHLAWLCISERSARVEKAEKQVAKMCSEHGVPVIVVVTQAFGKEEFVTAIRELIPEAKAIVPLMAEAEKIPPFPAYGLPQLVKETERFLPHAVENAFIAAQQVDIDSKRSIATKLAIVAASGAMAAAFIPIPLAGTAGLIASNASMVAGIAATMGVVMDRKSILALAASLAGGLAASSGGRLLLGEALKLLPGAGTVAGTVVEASVAGATTYGLGIGLIEFLLWFHSGNERMPDGSELKVGFTRFWANRPNKEIIPPR